jgi:flagellar biosynthetic protein FliR
MTQYTDLLNLGLLQLQIFLLIFIRVASIFMTAPVIGSTSVPVITRIGLAFMISFIIYPIMDHNVRLPREVLSYGLIAFNQVLFGVILGYASYLVFTAIQLSGQIIDLQMGFGIVNVIDPMSNTQVSIIGQFQFILGVLIFLAINGHHVLFQAVVDSFRIVPIAQVGITQETATKLADLFYNMFIIAFKIAGPATLALLLTNITLGFIARTIPQMNVFMVGLPLNIMVGLAAVLISMPVIVNLFSTLLTDMWNDIYYLLQSMRV